MRTLLAGLALMIAMIAFPTTTEAGAKIVIHSENFVIRQGQAGFAEGRVNKYTGTAALGATTYFYFDEDLGIVSLQIGKEPQHDQGPKWLAATAQLREDGLSLLLQRFHQGEIVNEERVGLHDFQVVTRELFIERGTDRRHVIRFTPLQVRAAQKPTLPPALAEAHLSAGRGPLLRNGELLQFLEGRISGERLFFHIPETGFVQLALRAWGDARPIGRLQGGVLSFFWRGDDYELYSQRSEQDLQGNWKVWVLVTREVPLDLAPLLQDIFPGEFAVGGTSLPSN